MAEIIGFSNPMKSKPVSAFPVHGIIVAYENPFIMPWCKFHGINSSKFPSKIMEKSFQFHNIYVYELVILVLLNECSSERKPSKHKPYFNY